MDNKSIINFLKENNIFPSKKLGQNFLLSDNYKQKIVGAYNISNDDFVIEIGPGIGALTEYIIKKTNNLVLIEFDKRLANIITNKYKDIKLINNDVLKTDIQELLDSSDSNKKIIISNLPYSISSKIIFKLLKCDGIDCMILMVQKEMADRITSTVNTEKYNGFSAMLSLFSNVTKLFDVPNTVFYPEPEVTSTVIKLVPKKDIEYDINEMEKFIKICFLNKRKKLVNNLKTKYSNEKIISTFNKLNIGLNIRAEQIEPLLFVELKKEIESES